MIPRPAPGAVSDYFMTYARRVPEDDVLAVLVDDVQSTAALLRELDDEQWAFRYAPGKWSVKELVGHLIDCERIFQGRALRFARGDSTPLPGFDENLYAAAGEFDTRSSASLIAEYEAVRASTLALFGGFTEEMLARSGEANGVPTQVGALAWVLAGHERHHLVVLRDRYLAR